MQHFLDRDIALGVCKRCKAYVFACMASGFKVAADPAPLGSLDAYRAALIAGKAVYELQERAGRPWRLVLRGRSTPAPVEAAGRLLTPSGRSLLADHGCAGSLNTSKFEVEPVAPPKAPAPYGLKHGAPANGSGTKETPATPVIHPPTDIEAVMPFCDVCRKRIKKDEPYIGIHHVKWVWAEHEECP